MIVGLENWTLARPEIFLAAATALLLIYGVVRGEIATAFVSVATSVALLVTAALLFLPYREGTAFSSLFIVDRLTATMKALVLVGSALAILMSRAYFEQAKAWRFEYPLVVALATLGMMLMISANDLMALYVGLELQSLALYVIAAFQRDSVRSTEAGVKYFVLGSVASGTRSFGPEYLIPKPFDPRLMMKIAPAVAQAAKDFLAWRCVRFRTWRSIAKNCRALSMRRARR